MGIVEDVQRSGWALGNKIISLSLQPGAVVAEYRFQGGWCYSRVECVNRQSTKTSSIGILVKDLEQGETHASPGLDRAFGPPSIWIFDADAAPVGTLRYRVPEEPLDKIPVNRKIVTFCDLDDRSGWQSAMFEGYDFNDDKALVRFLETADRPERMLSLEDLEPFLLQIEPPIACTGTLPPRSKDPEVVAPTWSFRFVWYVTELHWLEKLPLGVLLLKDFLLCRTNRTKRLLWTISWLLVALLLSMWSGSSSTARELT
jgi:hypothetical protein